MFKLPNSGELCAETLANEGYILMRHENMEKRLKFSNKFTGHFLLLFLLLFAITVHRSEAFGFDSANSCSPNKMSRRGRAQMLAAIPCDLSRQAYCHLPGAAYPWHAVRRFVHENQGLMKRMYGDVRHISILRNEIQNNDIDMEDVEQTAARYSRDGFRKTKVMHNQFENAKNNEVLKEPHFRPVTLTSTQSSSSSSSSTTPTTTTTEIPVTTDATTIPAEPATTPNDADLEQSPKEAITTTTTPKSTTQKVITPPVTSEASKRQTSKLDDVELDSDDEDDDDDDDSDDDDRNLESNSVYEPTSPNPNSLGDNIKIVESPKLGINITQSATISTTLKVVAPQTTKNVSPALTTSAHPIHMDRISETINQIANMTKVRVNGLMPTTPLKLTTTSNTNSSSNSLHNLYNNSPTEPTSKVSEIKKPTVATIVTKPVLRDGQLFQDTVHKDPLPQTNLKGVNACPVKEEVVAPFWANNTRGEVLALLNLYPFEQYVHWEKCTHEHKQMYCRDGCRCEQQYRLHRLLAYDPHNECRGIFSDWFRFPSCCICKCYDIPPDFRATSRSPRSEADYRHPAEVAEAEVRKAVYEHASENWYRPRDEFDLYDSNDQFV